MNAYLTPLLGGVLIGLSATWLLVLNGRIAGISGILGGLLGEAGAERGWRFAFLAGLLLGGAVLHLTLDPSPLRSSLALPLPLILGAGLLVGFGTRLGGGCTSGHGVCGLSRGSLRSLVATGVFMVVAALTVFLVRHVVAVREALALGGGAP